MSINENEKEIFQQIIEQLEEDKKLAQRDLNRNLDRISEININLKSLLDNEELDINIFSPRNIENLYGEKIVLFNEEKSMLEEKNRDNYANINRLSVMLNKMYSLVELNDSNNKVVPINKQEGYNPFFLLETDRQRIAKDLHDTSLQNLTAIIHKVELASMYINQDPIRAKMELSIISDSIKETIKEIRDTIFELRPMSFDDLGFNELLDSYLEKEIKNKNISILYDKYILNTKDKSILIFTFRVIKECISNSIKHSKCDEIHITINDSDGENLYIEIKDNGTGFDVDVKNLEKNKHFGLIFIKERVKLMQGNIDIKSNNNGTKVKISIPINNI